MSSQPNATAQTEDFEFAALNEAVNYRAALLEEFGQHLQGRVLEVGAGIGQFSGELRVLPGIAQLLSVEPEPQFCAEFRRRCPQLELLQGTVGDLPPGTAWDAVLSINVLEHIESDEHELSAYGRLLQPARGTLCLFVPARPEIYAPIDRDFGHFRRYTKPELKRKLERAGFELVSIRYYNFAGYLAWWLNFCVLGKRGFDVGSVRFFDRIIFPSMHFCESKMCAPPIGQSLIVVARAKA